MLHLLFFHSQSAPRNGRRREGTDPKSRRESGSGEGYGRARAIKGYRGEEKKLKKKVVSRGCQLVLLCFLCVYVTPEAQETCVSQAALYLPLGKGSPDANLEANVFGVVFVIFDII